MECGGDSLLSWGETITGIKHDKVTTKTFAEGTNAVGSPGFAGLTSYICAEGHMTTILKWVSIYAKPASFDPNAHILQLKKTMSSISIYSRGIFMTWIYSALKPSLVTDHYLGQYIRYTFILHDSWEAGRYSVELTYTFATECGRVSPGPLRNCVTLWPFVKQFGNHS